MHASKLMQTLTIHTERIQEHERQKRVQCSRTMALRRRRSIHDEPFSQVDQRRPVLQCGRPAHRHARAHSRRTHLDTAQRRPVQHGHHPVAGGCRQPRLPPEQPGGLQQPQGPAAVPALGAGAPVHQLANAGGSRSCGSGRRSRGGGSGGLGQAVEVLGEALREARGQGRGELWGFGRGL